MSNNPEHEEKIYERAINYMNKAQKVSQDRIASCSLYNIIYNNCCADTVVIIS